MQSVLKYNEASFNWAKRTIITEIDTIESTMGKISVPDVCIMASKLLLDQLAEYDHGMHYTKKYAFHVISSFARQLSVHGQWEFGTENILEIIPDKYLTEKEKQV